MGMTMRIFLAAALVGCTGHEAITVDLSVAPSAAAIPAAATDLGYTVQLTELRAAVSMIQFTIEGETHADVAPGTTARLAPLPHPGHSAGGEVTGELPGDYILHWTGSAQPALGIATLIVGDYFGANFALRAAGATDGLAAGDRLLGHTYHLTGTVTRDTTTRPFVAVLDVEPDSAVIGAPFEHAVTETAPEMLAIEFLPTDPFEGDTPYDGIDFFTLPESAGVIEILPGSIPHNILRRAIQTHDHYAVAAQ